jgi:hypothetical protein
MLPRPLLHCMSQWIIATGLVVYKLFLHIVTELKYTERRIEINIIRIEIIVFIKNVS